MVGTARSRSCSLDHSPQRGFRHRHGFGSGPPCSMGQKIDSVSCHRRNSVPAILMGHPYALRLIFRLRIRRIHRRPHLPFIRRGSMVSPDRPLVLSPRQSASQKGHQPECSGLLFVVKCVSNSDNRSTLRIRRSDGSAIDRSQRRTALLVWTATRDPIRSGRRVCSAQTTARRSSSETE